MGTLRKGWMTRHTKQRIEIIPLDDEHKHIGGEHCVCNPQVDETDDGVPVITHTSFDKREYIEELIYYGLQSKN